MKLIINWSDFTNTINNFIEEGNSLNFPDARNLNLEGFEKVNSNFISWTNKVTDYLNSSFDVSQNEYSSGFKHAKKQRFNLQHGNKLPSQLLTELKEDLKEKIKTLEYTLRILAVSDAIIKPDQVDLVDRKNYSVEQTLNFILDKLYALYDDSYHSIVAIMNGNAIEMKRSNEDRELGKYLEDSGYVDLIHHNHTLAKLTLNGRLFVEEKRKEFIENYEDISFDKAQLNERIDEIIERLNNLGLGQEILFEELQDLRETYVKLSKKSWVQLLKGKLFDLALAKLVDNDTIGYVYDKLTGHELRLP